MLLKCSLETAFVIRRFSIFDVRSSCDHESGWLVVKDSTLRTPCNIDKVNLTTIWYSALQTKTKFNGNQTFYLSCIFCFLSVMYFLNQTSLYFQKIVKKVLMQIYQLFKLKTTNLFGC